MYLKINYLNQTKKVVVKDELKTQEGFFELMGRVAKLNRDEFKVVFTDRENDTVGVQDQFDLDYFFNDGSSNSQLAVTILPLDAKEPAKPAAEEKPAEAKEQTPAEAEIVRNFAGLPFFVSCARPTAEMNIQTEKVGTTEAFVETNACQLTHAGQQTAANQECKETQTKKAESAEGIPAPLAQMLLERIEALEQSFRQSLNGSMIRTECAPDTPLAKPVEAPAQPKPAESVSKTQVTTSHLGITCDGCHKHNFVGKRYKCLVCPDFDLCEGCEEKNEHQHPMIRITSQGNNFVLEKMRRKWGKFTNGSRFGGAGPHGQTPFGRGIGQAIQSIFGVPVPPARCGKPNGPRGCPFKFAEAPKEEAKPQPREDRHMADKRQMLEFMLPEHPQEWEGILQKYGNLSLEEFCAVMSAWEPKDN